MDPHHFGNLDRIRIKEISWIRNWSRIRISLQITSQNVWNLSLFLHFYKGLSLYLEARIWIRIRKRIRVISRIPIRIRIRINVVRIHNTGFRRLLPYGDALPYRMLLAVRFLCFCVGDSNTYRYLTHPFLELV
jgi:hypothetical protein